MVRVFRDEEAVARAAARLFLECSQTAISKTGRFSVALSGGNSPVRTYQLLAEEPFKTHIDWAHVHVFWGDERCVPPTDPRSNYGISQRALLSRVPIPASQVHPIVCASDPRHAALEYESALRKTFSNGHSTLDLVFLGLGTDGHTASLFPQSAASTERTRWVCETRKPGETISRITVTPAVINQAQLVLFLVTGREKAEVLARLASEAASTDLMPVQAVRPTSGGVLWLVDSLAYPLKNGNESAQSGDCLWQSEL